MHKGISQSCPAVQKKCGSRRAEAYLDALPHDLLAVMYGGR